MFGKSVAERWKKVLSLWFYSCNILTLQAQMPKYHADVYRSAANEERFDLVIDYLFEKWCKDQINVNPDTVTDEMLIERFGNNVVNAVYLQSNKSNKNTNKTTIKNNNKIKYEKENENKNNNVKNIHLDAQYDNNSIDKILDTWEMECKNLQNEFRKRELEKCNCLNEKFDVLIEIENMKLKLEKILIDSLDDRINLHKTETTGESNANLVQDIINVKYHIKSVEEKLLHQEVQMKERNKMDDSKRKEIETDIKGQKNVLIEQNKNDEASAIKCKELNKANAECVDLIQNVKTIVKYITINKETNKFNQVLCDVEWTILKRFTNSIFTNSVLIELNSNDENVNHTDRSKVLEYGLAKSNVNIIEFDIEQLVITQNTGKKYGNVGSINTSSMNFDYQQKQQIQYVYFDGLINNTEACLTSGITLCIFRNFVSCVNINVQGYVCQTTFDENRKMENNNVYIDNG